MNTKKPLMINAVNNFDETPLMLAKNKRIRTRLLGYMKIPPENIEPSKNMDYFHNIDVFGTLLRLAEKEAVDKIRLLKCPALKEFTKEMYRHREDVNGETALHISARKSNSELFVAVRELNLINLEKRNNDGRTALHVASFCGNLAVVQNLLDSEQVTTLEENEHLPVVNVNTQDKKGKTALHLAALRGNVSVLTALLGHNHTEVNPRDKKGETPLFDAVNGNSNEETKKLDVLKVFLEYEAVDWNVRNTSGENFMHKIAKSNLINAAELVLNRTDIRLAALENENKYTPLHVAIRKRCFGVAQVLSQVHEFDINQRDKHGNTALHLLCDIETSSLTSSLKPREGGLAKNTLQGMLDVLGTILARKDIDLNIANARGDVPLHVATRVHNQAVAERLLASSDIQPNRQNSLGETPLHVGVLSDNVEMVSELLARNDVLVNIGEKNDDTALHCAARYDRVGAAEMLLARDDINVEARAALRMTPLHMAAAEDSVGVAGVLLARDDVNINARREFHETPLHLAAARNSVKVAKLLLATDGVDADAKSHDQRTPLHHAAVSGSVEIAAMLVARNDVDVLAAGTANEITPITVASMHLNEKVVEFLRTVPEVQEWLKIQIED